jgi:hypothetical protein
VSFSSRLLVCALLRSAQVDSASIGGLQQLRRAQIEGMK